MGRPEGKMMRDLSEKTYLSLSESIRKKAYLGTFLNLLDKLITWITFLSYPLLLVYLSFHQKALMLPEITVPAVSFLAVSLFRKQLNAKRPYELYHFTPVIHKETFGCSFPSRHVFSIFMIAMAFFYYDHTLGFDFMILGGILALIRVLGGVHFIRDVLAGACAGIICGIVGFYVVF